MVVDGSRIPAPGPSRSRLARGSTASRIPTRRDTPSNTTPRRASRAGAETETNSTTPRRISNIPTPRRVSKVTNDTNEPTIRRISRTPAKINPDRQDPPSATRTPRRTALRMSHSNQVDPSDDNHTSNTRRTSIPTPRRLSGANGESRIGTRLPVVRPTGRLSSTSAHDTPTRTRADRTEASHLPDRGTSSIVQPSPVSRRTSNHTQRTSMFASPYARRTSGAGRTPGTGRTSGTGRTNGTGGKRSSLISPTTGRRVSNNIAADSNGIQSTTPRRLSSSRPASRRASGSSKLLAPGERFQRPDRIETRRDSNVSARSRNGLSALESFRAVRRASIGSDHQAVTQEKQSSQEIPTIEASSNDDTSIDDLLEDAKESFDSTPTPATPTATPDPLGCNNILEELDHVPDRLDMLVSEMPMEMQSNERRTSTRFSDANVCLDNVEKLRESLGRRRSHGIHDGQMPEAPQLRRSSLSKKYVEGALVEPPKLEELDSSITSWQRSPLKSIETNFNEEATELKQKRMSIVPHLDDDDLCLNEEVEDLGVW